MILPFALNVVSLIIITSSLFVRSTVELKITAENPGVFAVFQGTCSLSQFTCDHECVDLGDGTFTCNCNAGYTLLADGTGCKRSNDTFVRLILPSSSDSDFKHGKVSSYQSGRRRNYTPIKCPYEWCHVEASYPVVPFFSGPRWSSFLVFDTPEQSHNHTNISISFKPYSKDGLLFFLGQKHGPDFITIVLYEGYPKLRLNCGNGIIEITLANQVQLQAWHTIIMIRDGCEYASLQLDSNPATFERLSPSNPSYNWVNQDRQIYVGGFPNEEVDSGDISSKSGTFQGFQGCIRDFVINKDQIIHDESDWTGRVVSGNAIDACLGTDCLCLNGGRCRLEAKERVKNGAIENGACDCPLFKAGPHCEDDLKIRVPQFSGNSFLRLEVDSRAGLSQYLDLEFEFKPEEGSGLVFFVGNSEFEEYIAVYLENGYVVLQFEMGSGPLIIKTENQIDYGVWQKVVVWRSGRGGLIKLNNGKWCEGSLSGGYDRIMSGKHMYFGWAPSETLPKRLQSQNGFRGCIKQVKVNQQRFDLLSEAEAGVNVHDCGWNPCIQQLCQRSSRCVFNRDSYLCLCPSKYTGQNCETEVHNPVQVIGLEGTGYLNFRQPTVLQELNKDEFTISLTFMVKKELRSDQILFVATENEHVFTDEHTGDFVKLSITSQGTILVQFQAALIASDKVSFTMDKVSVHDFKWHKIVFIKKLDRIEVFLDETESWVHVLDPGYQKIGSMNFQAVYIGGFVPTTATEFVGSGLYGCISEVLIGDRLRIDQISQSSDASNVKDCIDVLH